MDSAKRESDLDHSPRKLVLQPEEGLDDEHLVRVHREKRRRRTIKSKTDLVLEKVCS
jgi:hypothetical protein